MIRVYQFGLRPPTENVELIRAQLRAAHDYRNDHVAIERGRRAVIRALSETEETRAAETLVRAATKSTRKEALRTLALARREARAAVVEEIQAIEERATSIRRDARALTPCYWGSYLTIEASADQVRKMPFYERDGVTPSDPRFVRWNGSGQIGVQLQGGLKTKELLEFKDTRLRIERRSECGRYGELSMRIGSNGRAPIWGRWPIKLHRAIPDNATIKWARVSCRHDGPFERWTCEITLDIEGVHPRLLDTTLTGAIAVDLEWFPDGVRIRVARWKDHNGATGEEYLSELLVKRLKKASGIRSVRDMLMNELRPKLKRALHEAKAFAPWLHRETATIDLWKSQSRFLMLVKRWRAERCDDAREAYDILQAWELRDAHLAEYEAGARRGALLARREVYRLLAVNWSRKYKTVVLADQDYRREARWGDDADVRQVVSPSELRGALRASFASDECIVPMPLSDPDEPVDMREYLIAHWNENTSAHDKKEEPLKKNGNAWAARKARKKERSEETARESERKSASG